MRKFYFLIMAFILLFVSACGSPEANEDEAIKSPQDISEQYINHVGDFSAITESEEDFNVSDLEGQWWIADFVFTNCTTVCLPMTANMAKLQGLLDEEEMDDVKLISFSVDPERDTPEVLRDYAEENNADLERWSFLTGYDFETIKNYSVETFKSLVQEPPEGDDQITHGTAFFLIDPDGNIVSHYSGTQADQMEVIINDLKEVR